MLVVSGEALIDVFVGDPTPTGITLDGRIGGSPFNVAVGLARLGQSVAFLGGISNGKLGSRLLEALRAERVCLDTVHRSDAPTTISLVGLNASGIPEYAFYGERAADRTLPLSALERIPENAQALHVGSYPMVVGETAATQRVLVERMHGNMVISYDPNLRLNVEPDQSAWRDALEWMLPRTDILKLSDEDFSLLHPGGNMHAFAADCLSKGVGLVVLTRGSQGATAWHRYGTCVMSPATVEVVDTVGAGDTFQAALLTRISELGMLSRSGIRGMSMDAVSDVVRFATHAAAITCSRRGADLPRRHEVGVVA